MQLDCTATYCTLTSLSPGTATLQNAALAQDKEVLTRNISCLFKTAQMELQRHVQQILELRKR